MDNILIEGEGIYESGNGNETRWGRGRSYRKSVDVLDVNIRIRR